MQNWYKVAEKQSIDKNGCKVVYFKRQEVVIFKYQECYFALGNNCPHRKAPLSAGEMAAPTERAMPVTPAAAERSSGATTAMV